MLEDFVNKVLSLVEGALARARVILGTVVTYLVMLVALGNLAIMQYGDDLPVVAEVATHVVVTAGSAIEIIRRVTPVAKDERGVLPQ